MGRWNHDWHDYFNKDNLKRMVKLNVCGICLNKPIDKQLHHIEYFAEGGMTEPENLCWLCAECHRKLHRQDNNLRKKNKWKKILSKLKSEGII